MRKTFAKRPVHSMRPTNRRLPAFVLTVEGLSRCNLARLLMGEGGISRSLPTQEELILLHLIKDLSSTWERASADKRTSYLHQLINGCQHVLIQNDLLLVVIQKLHIDGLELCPVHLQVLIDATETQGLGEGTKWEGNHWNGLELHPAAAFEESAVSYHHQRIVLWGQAAPSLEERISRH